MTPRLLAIWFQATASVLKVGKGTAQKDTIINTTSDSQVNSNFPHRWSPASLTFNNYFYLFLYLYITRIAINNNTPHQKSPKNQNRRAALGRPAMKLMGGGGGGGGGLQLVCGRPTLALSSALVPQTLSCLYLPRTNISGEKNKLWKHTHSLSIAATQSVQPSDAFKQN